MTGYYFCLHHNNRWKLTKILDSRQLFFKTYILWHIKLNIYIWKTKYTTILLLCSERTRKLLKIAAAKYIYLKCKFIDITCFNECFLFHETTGRHCCAFCKSLSEGFFNRPVVPFFEISVLKEVHFYVISTITAQSWYISLKVNLMNLLNFLKGVLMQIWKSPYMFVFS